MKLVEWSDLSAFALETAPAVDLLASNDFEEVLRHLVRAMTQGSHLVLLDADAAERERAMAMAILNSRTQERAHLRKLPDLTAGMDTWRSHWLGNKRFRLSLFTSGTTAAPKHLVHSIETLVRRVRADLPAAQRVWGSAYHPAHMSGIQLMLQAIWNADPVLPLDALGYHSLEKQLNSIPLTHLVGTPSFFRLQVPFAAPCETVEQVTLGGEPLDEALMARLHFAFPKARFRNIYASTEAGSILASDGIWFRIPKELEDLVRVQDEEICLHPKMVGQGALPDGGCEAWFRTGDLVDYDPSGTDRFQIRRRKGEVIHTAGYRVDPAVVEAALQSIPGILLARVYGRENPVVGTIICADLHGAPISDQKLREHLRHLLANYQIPRLYKWLEEPGLTVSGKLARRKMCSESP